MQTKLLQPKTLAAIKDLALVARMVVEGFLAGSHNSIKRGAGMEFSQYRSYQPGDDLRQLDWKMFARSDRYYIRESESDTNLRVQLVLDASNSMNYEEAGLSKIRYAKLVAACLGFLAARQGDEIALYALQENNLVYEVAGGPNHLPRFFRALENLTAHGQFASAPIGQQLILKTKKKTITIFLSDMYEQEAEIFNLVKLLRSRGQEVLFMHLVGEEEMNLSYSGNILFEDLETGQTIQVDPATHGPQYRENYQNWLKNLTSQMQKNQITYERYLLHEPLDKALRLLLKHRSAR